MPTEDDLRAALRGADAPNRLDPARVIRRARTRRVPMQVGGTLVGMLALTTVGVLTLNGLPPSSPSALDTAMIAESGAGGSQNLDASDLKRIPADRLNLCAAAITEVPPSASGLELTVEFPATVPIGTDPIEGLVRLTNTSTNVVTGTTAAVPALTLAENGVTMWHTNGAMILSLVDVDLDPGESLTYRATLETVRCGPEDDASGFRPDLPSLTAGAYTLSAAIDFSPTSAPADAPALAELVSGPPVTIVLE